MSVSKGRPQPGPGAPLTGERERYLRLVAQGMIKVQACREVGVHRITGTRWRDGRKMVDSGGRARYWPPIAAPPVVISARFLSEDERVLIGDLLGAGQSVRSIAAWLA
jgi:IS30 family transposase